MTSSMLVASIPERSPTCLMGIAARSAARPRASDPPCLPTGVRRAAQTKASRVTFPVSRFPFPGFSQAHPYRLRLRIVVQRLLAQITPEPRELVAAKRGGGVIEVVRVHPHRARLDRARHAVRFLHVLGPDARREAVARAVGELDALRLALEREHRQYRPEDFFVHDLHAGCGAVEHGRLDVEALAVDLGRLAAGHEPGAILRSRGDVGEHRFLLSLGYDGAESAVAPGPGTTFRAPGGRPAASAISPSSRAVRGVSWAGLSTTVHPAASAGATFHVARFNGKFHGTIAPTTPTGSRSVYVKKLPLTGSVSPVSLSAQPA